VDDFGNLQDAGDDEAAVMKSLTHCLQVLLSKDKEFLKELKEAVTSAYVA